MVLASLNTCKSTAVTESYVNGIAPDFSLLLLVMSSTHFLNLILSKCGISSSQGIFDHANHG